VKEGEWYFRHVTFRGLHFQHADWVLPPEGHADYPQTAVRVGAAFEAEAAEDCAIEECSFQRLGGYAMWFAQGCKRNRIVGNHMSDIGAGGIKIGETVMRESPARRNFEHLIEDNHIHHLGEVYPEAIGISRVPGRFSADRSRECRRSPPASQPVF